MSVPFRAKQHEKTRTAVPFSLHFRMFNWAKVYSDVSRLYCDLVVKQTVNGNV